MEEQQLKLSSDLCMPTHTVNSYTERKKNTMKRNLIFTRAVKILRTDVSRSREIDIVSDLSMALSSKQP